MRTHVIVGPSFRHTPPPPLIDIINQSSKFQENLTQRANRKKKDTVDMQSLS